MNTPKIQAIGTAVPPHRIMQEAYRDQLISANGMSREEILSLKLIYNRSGIQSRHAVLAEFGGGDAPDNQIFHPSGHYPNTPVARRMAIFEEHAGKLALDAATQCFEALPYLERSDVTHVISFSCTGMYAPGLDIELVENLGLPRSAERTCINFMGCYAAINALKTAYHIARSEPEAVILLGGVELCTLHYQKNKDPNQMVANALFGDGAAAVIVSAKNLRSDDDQVGFCLRSFYSEFEQSASNEMVWRIGETGFDLRLTPEVPNIVRENIQPLLEKLFARTGITAPEIDFYAIHPGGVKILQACEEALGITKEDNATSYGVLKEYGNMSSVTVLFVLKEYLRTLKASDRGKKILACAFGPGITMESLIAEVC